MKSSSTSTTTTIVCAASASCVLLWILWSRSARKKAALRGSFALPEQKDYETRVQEPEKYAEKSSIPPGTENSSRLSTGYDGPGTSRARNTGTSPHGNLGEGALSSERNSSVSSLKIESGSLPLEKSTGAATRTQQSLAKVIPAQGGPSRGSPSPPGNDVYGNAAREIQYQQMQDAFLAEGMDVQAVESAQLSFGGLEEKEWPGIWPKPYSHPFPSVRLVVFPLDGGQFGKDSTLARSFTQVGKEVFQCLAFAGYQVYMNPRSSYHASVFYLSHPNDVRVDPASSGGGELFKNGQLAVPNENALEKELNLTRAELEGTPCFTLKIDRVVLTREGTLLVLFQDASVSAETPGFNTVDALRRDLRLTFPGAPAQQPVPLVHCTLLRVLAPATDFPPDTKNQISNICAKWTKKLHGMEYIIDRAWLVHEKKFSSLEGDKETLLLSP